MKRINKYVITLMLMLSMLALVACGRQKSSEDVSTNDASDYAVFDSTVEIISSEAEQSSAASSEAVYDEPSLDESGTYTSKEDVALYLHIYGQLPSNFITKKEAKKLGWSGGGLEEYAPGMCIGGEGLLPEDKEYHECDIDTLGKKSRGAKRIIYSDDGYIYYTEDHYESFELLYEPGA